MSDLKEQIRTYFEATTDATAIDPAADTPSAGVPPVGRRTVHAMAESTPAVVPARKWWRHPAIAAAAIVLAAAGLSMLVFGTESVDVAAPPSPEDAASAVIDEFFAAYEVGDVARMRSAMAENVVITGYLGNSFDEVMAWSMAQQFELGDRNCEVDHDADAASTRVVCEYEASDELARTFDLPSDLITATFAVSDAGEITFYNERLISDTYFPLTNNFEAWMQAAHPEVSAGIGCCEWDSVEEAAAGGAARVEFADEYAAYLEEYDCTYDLPCRR